jgi:hypothetical protein
MACEYAPPGVGALGVEIIFKFTLVLDSFEIVLDCLYWNGKKGPLPLPGVLPVRKFFTNDLRIPVSIFPTPLVRGMLTLIL